MDYTYSVQDPIIDWQRPGEILRKPRIQWPTGNKKAIWTNLDQELSFILKGPIRQRMFGVFFAKIIYDLCFECFDPVMGKKKGKNQSNQQK